MRNFIFLISTIVAAPALGQAPQRAGSFDVRIAEVFGDLNNDKLPDRVLVTQDTADDKAPYRLQVFFAAKGGGQKLQVSTVTAIEPGRVYGREAYITGTRFSEITISHGLLSVAHELTRGHYVHKYRYRHGAFELIGFLMTNSDGQVTVTTIDFNLSTGVRIEKEERYDIDKLVSFSRKRVFIRPLPRLKNINAFEDGIF